MARRRHTTIGVAGDIAVIGIACRFPGARNCHEYWTNLVEGRVSIGEIPPDRWRWQKYWGDPRSGSNTCDSKWGGFIDGVDGFDAELFGLSTKEVEAIDPQQRLALELAWACFEDAAIRPSTLAGTGVGVFIGAMNLDYREVVADAKMIGAYHETGLHASVIPNRISYHFHFRGPSLPIDTACSSSLYALHAACNAIRHGECDAALAGGITLILRATNFVGAAQLGMLSPTGVIRTFDEGADGTVLGEGGGLLLLKPLATAIADGDRVIGVIKGSAVNHSGRTYSLTYPSATAQADVIVGAHEAATVTPRDVSYVEVHGTGTPKGDPVEMEGLLDAWARMPGRPEPKGNIRQTALGCVKPNIGHLQAAAGIAGVIKVLLALQHGILPPLANFKKLNPRISLDGSGFYVADRQEPWDSGGRPRVAGVSGFGFSGANAHVVIGDTPATSTAKRRSIHSDGRRATRAVTSQDHRARDIKDQPPVVIVLSAKDADRLREQAARLLEVVLLAPEANLASLAYTLQVGREPMDHRLALTASSIDDLAVTLRTFIDDPDTHADGLRRGVVDASARIRAARNDPSEALSEFVTAGRSSRLIDLWVAGSDLDWNQAYRGERPSRVSLPVYPFARGKYWIREAARDAAAMNTPGAPVASQGLSTATETVLHPLVHRNTSTLKQQRFSSTFRRDAFGTDCVPPLVYVEMVMAAVELAAEAGRREGQSPAIHVSNMIWSAPPATPAEQMEIDIILAEQADDVITFEICREDSRDADEGAARGEVKLHGPAVCADRQARVIAEATRVDLDEVRAKCPRPLLVRDVSLVEAVVACARGERTTVLLAKINLPERPQPGGARWILDSVSVDKAVRLCVELCGTDGGEQGTTASTAPWSQADWQSLDRLDVLRACPSNCWMWLRCWQDGIGTAGRRTLDIDICDDGGNVCVRMRGLLIAVEGEDASQPTLLVPSWRRDARSSVVTEALDDEWVVVLCDAHDASADSALHHRHQLQFAEELRQARCLVLSAGQRPVDERFAFYTVELLSTIRGVLERLASKTVLIQVVVSTAGEDELLLGLSGLLRTAWLENPRLRTQIVGVDPDEPAESVAQALRRERVEPLSSAVRYQGGRRFIQTFGEVAATAPTTPVWQDGGAYLITGGAGGLGRIFAREICGRTRGATVVLTGRSALDDRRRSLVHALSDLGARCDYRQLDVTDQASVQMLCDDVLNRYGRLNGILHAAGDSRDAFLLRKREEDVHAVLAPKVRGLLNLDRATSGIVLDLFALFASHAGVLGNVAQADYSAANAFMDIFAHLRNRRVAAGERHGLTVSIDWPLWLEGGMQMDAATLRGMRERRGMIPMDTRSGLDAFHRCLALGVPQVLVAAGNPRSLDAAIAETLTPLRSQAPASSAPVDGAALRQRTLDQVKLLFAAATELDVSKIDAEEGIDAYGFDSIIAADMNQRLTPILGRVSATLFFDCRTLSEVTDRLLKEHREGCVRWSGIGDARPEVPDTPAVTASLSGRNRQMDRQTVTSDRTSRRGSRSRAHTADITADPIAIIGLSGRYPKAANLEEFWENLQAGRDCIGEIPSERWVLEGFYNPNIHDALIRGQSYSKWGGFLDGFADFDPRFFRISPHESLKMDPQERLFLQTSWAALEDAGYTRQLLQARHRGGVGVFVGVTKTGFELHGPHRLRGREPIYPRTSFSSVANRVSHFLDINGPSMPIDTMCSGSLTAIHEACEHLTRDECELAIAGGVNLYLHPTTYLRMCADRMLSPDGRCKSFGQGNGFVPGEGVGAVVLKRLSRAIADRDPVHAVIRATGINHSGKTSGYTVPSPPAQGALIRTVIAKAGLDARMISCVEAHGTGTELGDPIEVAGLTHAFRQDTCESQFCALGSVKSNIGNCESASGIAALTKVILQLRHGQLVPSLHADTLNPEIDFPKTPFFVQRRRSEWKRPVILLNGRAVQYPRVAGISSFGAGGANAHIIVSECPDTLGQSGSDSPVAGVVAVVLSAQDEDALLHQASNLLRAVETRNLSDRDLPDVAYTLQVGREPMRHRLAVVCESMADVQEKLTRYQAGEERIEGLYRGDTKRNRDAAAPIPCDDERRDPAALATAMAERWVDGVQVEWAPLHADGARRRMRLPTYPFSRERYWFDVDPGAGIQSSALAAACDREPKMSCASATGSDQ